MRFRHFAAPLLAGLLLPLAGCGSGGQESASLSTENPTTVTVSDTAGVPSAFLEYGQRQGIFRQHGLKLNINTGAGGAETIPGVVSGTYDFGGSNIMSVIVANAKDVPVTMVAPGTSERDSAEEAFGTILASPDSGITEPEDLAGKTVAINTLDGIAELTTKISLDNHGVDPSSVKLTEIGFPNMLSALDQGRIDAAWEIEPFVTLGLDAGNEPILHPYIETKPGMQVGSYVTSRQYQNENPEVVKAFQAGVADTAAAISESTEDFRGALPELTELSAEEAQQMDLPQWKASVDKDTVELLNRKTAEYGYIDSTINIDDMLAPGAVK